MDEARYTCLDLSSSGEGSEGGRVGRGEGRKEGGKRKRKLEEGEGGGGGGKRPRVGGGGQAEDEEDDNDETRLDEEALLLQYQNGEFQHKMMRKKVREMSERKAVSYKFNLNTVL